MNQESGFFKLGCFSLAGLAAAAVVILFVTGASLFGGGVLFSPGALNAQAGPQPLGGAGSHAAIACAGCHPAPWSGQTMTGLCLDCHTDLSQDPKNFHKIMIAEGPSNGCIQCHTDHHGPQAAQTRFDTSAFPHNAMGFSLLAHPKMADGSTFQCSGCHPASFTRFDPAVCATCHFDINKAFLTTHLTDFGEDCLACHDGLDSYGHTFDHTQATFALTGKHAAVPCGKCHVAAINLAALKAAPTNCAACHAKDDAHQGAFGQDCAQCHTADSWQTAKVDHNKTAFPLFGKHESVACTDCHVNQVFKGTPATCFACHAKDDSHKGAFGQDCAECHTPANWQDATIDHNKTAFPLTGRHISVACTACHLNQVFKGTPVTCAGCHADPAFHKGLFSGECASCHTTSAWLPAKFNGPHTFPLNHGRAVSCADCHIDSLLTYTCFTCHAQPEMAREHRRVSAADLPNCVKCHATGRGD